MSGGATSCAAVRRLIESALDGPVDRERSDAVAAHVVGCEACRDYGDSLRDVCGAVAALETIPLPDAALKQIIENTVEARRVHTFRRTVPAVFAAAAAIALVLIAPRASWFRADTTVEADRLAVAARQTSLVLRLTGDALRRVNRLAVEQVLAERVSPAVQRLAFPWSKPRHLQDRSPEL